LPTGEGNCPNCGEHVAEACSSRHPQSVEPGESGATESTEAGAEDSATVVPQSPDGPARLTGAVERFGLSKAYLLFDALELDVWLVGIPLILTVGLAMLWSHMPSRQQGVLCVLTVAAWIVGGVWFAIRWRKLARRWQFSIALTEEAIAVEDRIVRWAEIDHAEITSESGLDPAIILHVPGGATMEIPGATSGLDYIDAVIRRRVEVVDVDD